MAEGMGGFPLTSVRKGHAMAGYGGAIKNISIGIASSEGKNHIHTAGQGGSMWSAPQDPFLESMAEAGKSVSDYLNGNILYINVMNRLSVDCDCDGSPAEPDMHDIGILASFDPVAVDQACIDLVYSAKDGQSLISRIESRNGLHTLEWAEEIGLGSREYTLVSVFLKDRIHGVSRSLGDKKLGLLGIPVASVLGIASPLCMYGTIPIAASFSRSGMKDDWLAAFMMSIVCMIVILFCFTACGSSDGNQNTGGQPETPKATVSASEKPDKSPDSEAVEQTMDQDAEIMEPADTGEETGEETNGEIAVCQWSLVGGNDRHIQGDGMIKELEKVCGIISVKNIQ